MLGVCALARSESTLKTSTAPQIFQTRIRPPSVSKLKYDVRDGRKIHRMSFLNGRLEANLLGGVQSGFVQSMSQALGHPNRLYLSRGPEDYFDQHFAFDSQLARFIRVNRIWLGQDHHRLNGRSVFRLLR